jgi:hypothetical protein
MMMYNINAGSKLNAVFKYSKSEATTSISLFYHNIGVIFDIDLIFPILNGRIIVVTCPLHCPIFNHHLF